MDFVEKKEIVDYGIRLAGTKRIIGMAFDRARLERNQAMWSQRDGYQYEIVQRVRVQLVSDWYDPLDTTV